MVVCSRCNEEKNKSEFTSAQLKKSGMLRRCKACTTDIQISERRASVQAASRTDLAEAAPKYLEAEDQLGKPICCRCGEGRDRSEFSNAQLKKAASVRKCRKCGEETIQKDSETNQAKGADDASGREDLGIKAEEESKVIAEEARKRAEQAATEEEEARPIAEESKKKVEEDAKQAEDEVGIK
jgi:hypothetical protein